MELYATGCLSSLGCLSRAHHLISQGKAITRYNKLPCEHFFEAIGEFRSLYNKLIPIWLSKVYYAQI